ncbi:Myb-like_DNA-binding domain-containing protein [Hexamita inflata]|uniref:Myb-like_DNA-binding domain-containing protein n=1 Tax=Hexamita inflata TaxID=28002 RepID=A0ABP1IAB6_9EUKA
MQQTPNGSYTKWESADEFKLKLAVEKYGNDWDAIHKYVFPERGAVCLKNKYYTKIHQNKAFEKQTDPNQLSKDEEQLLLKVRQIITNIE